MRRPFRSIAVSARPRRIRRFGVPGVSFVVGGRLIARRVLRPPSGRRAGLGEDVRHVHAHGLVADDKVLGGLAVRTAGVQEGQDLPFCAVMLASAGGLGVESAAS